LYRNAAKYPFDEGYPEIEARPHNTLKFTENGDYRYRALLNSDEAEEEQQNKNNNNNVNGGHEQTEFSKVENY
jgi:hypothetical protein